MIVLHYSDKMGFLLAKIASWLLNMNLNYLNKLNKNNIVEDVIKILKTGGKVD